MYLEICMLICVSSIISYLRICKIQEIQALDSQESLDCFDTWAQIKTPLFTGQKNIDLQNFYRSLNGPCSSRPVGHVADGMVYIYIYTTVNID